MWRFSLLAVVRMESELSSHDACNFVGARFAKVQSTCDDDVCTNIGFFGDQIRAGKSLQSVPCMYARGFAEDWTERHGEAENTSLVGDLLHSTVLLALSEFIYHGNESVPREAMAAVSAGIGEYVSMNLDRNNPTGVDLENLRVMFSQVADLALRAPYWFRSEPLTANLHLYFDIAAAVGHFLLDDEIVAARSVIGQDAPSYRDLDHREFSIAPTAVGLPSVAADLVALSALLAKLTKGESVTDDEVGQLHLFLIGFHRSSTAVSSTEVLIHDQLYREVCPNIVRALQVLGSRVNDPNGVPAVKIGIGFLHLCSPAVGYHVLIHGSIALIQRRDFEVDPSSLSTYDPTFLMYDSVNWAAWPPISMSERDVAETSLMILLDFVNNVGPLNRPTSSNEHATLALREELKGEFPVVMVALGRGIGLAVRVGVDLDRLDMDPNVLLAINPFVQTPISDRDREALAYIRVGVEEMLGPAYWLLLDRMFRGLTSSS